MKIGFMQAYNEVNWIGYAIEQAILLCDKLVITEGAQCANFPNISERSDDGTLDIITDKMKIYSDRIQLINTIRHLKNWQLNQCANYNRVLDSCDIGDYFLKLDVDEFCFDGFIEKMNNLMDEGKADCLKTYKRDFAFSFRWAFNVSERIIFFKKTPDLHFLPTCKPLGYGPNMIEIKNASINHYTFVKPRERIRMRMMTSGFHKNMLGWFDANWDTIELGDGNPFKYADKVLYTFKIYDGKHPSILDDHPWRHIEDLRKAR